MALVKLKPTSAGRRHAVKVVNKELHKGKPWAALTEKKNRGSGRNNNGHITCRHKGGGAKRAYRIIDFKRQKDGVPARVERIEYDPNRSAHIALVCYADGERCYIIAPKGLTVGQEIMNGPESPIKVGNTLPLRNIPVGSTIHCIEMLPGKGAQMVRAAGAFAQTRGPVKVNTPRSASVPVKSAAFSSNAAPRSVRSATKKTASANSAKGRCQSAARCPSDGPWRCHEPG